MQVQSTSRISQIPTIRTGETKPIRAAFDDVYESCRIKAEQKNPVVPPSLFHDRPPMVKLGTISRDEPTVSHLLVDHPEYDRDCWETIHSEQNRSKPYTRIPPGTSIFLDPRSNEISWDFSMYVGKPNPAEKVISSPVAARRLIGDYFTRRQDNKSGEQRLIDSAISRAAATYDLPRELIRGVIKAESDFQALAVSPAGAQGLMQLMPATSRELGVENPFDIEQNIDGGARYLKKMLEIFDGDIEQALAAYNAGPGAVKKYNGRVPYEETRFYVQRVLSYMDSKT